MITLSMGGMCLRVCCQSHSLDETAWTELRLLALSWGSQVIEPTLHVTLLMVQPCLHDACAHVNSAEEPVRA